MWMQGYDEEKNHFRKFSDMWDGDLFFSGPQYDRRMTPCENGQLVELQIFKRMPY